MLPSLSDDLTYNDAPRIVWVRVTDAVERLWVENPKLHNIGDLTTSFQRYGLQSLPKFSAHLEAINGERGAIVFGNGRIETLDLMEKSGSDLPRGLATTTTGEWALPILVGTEFESDLLAKSYGIDDNNLTITGSSMTALDMARLWDNEKYLSLLKTLGDAHELPVSVDGDDLDMLLALGRPPSQTPPARMGEIPALLEKWQPKLGDLWIAGKHRILCGDATSADDHARLMDGVIPLLMMTDPPYGVSLDHAWRTEAIRSRGSQKLLNQRQSSRAGQIENDDRVDWGVAYTLYSPQVLYVWHAGAHAGEVQISLIAAGYDVRQQIIWVKPQMVLSRQAYHWRHEPCYYAVREGANGNWCGDRKQTTIWEMDSPISSSTAKSDLDDAATLHPTQKPVEAYQRAIINHTRAGDVTCDPFLGSGTAVVAAESLNRACYAVELDPRFMAVTLQRLEDMNLKPERQSE